MSSAWERMVRPRSAAMAKAFAMMALSCTPLPSSVMNLISSGSVSRWSSVLPSKFWVMDTVWLASHRPTSLALSCTAWAISGVEHTGLVLGIRFTKVYPPAAAAREPVSTSSLYSRPGVRQWQWVSMKEGSSVRRLASSTVSPSGTGRSTPTAAIFPSRSQTSTGRPVQSLAFLMSMGSLLTFGQKKTFPGEEKSNRKSCQNVRKEHPTNVFLNQKNAVHGGAPLSRWILYIVPRLDGYCQLLTNRSYFREFAENRTNFWAFRPNALSPRQAPSFSCLFRSNML